MYTVKNKPYIDKCIVSFSHNRFSSRAEADRVSLEKARREITSGKRGISHLILRAEDDKIDRLKFLFPVHGIPIMCFALVNLIFSSLREIVVVGSMEVKQVLDVFLDVVGSNGKAVRFIQENPESLSLGTTMNLGRSQFDLEKFELVLFQPGDLPFLYDIEKVIQDKDIEGHNLILWLNARSRMFPQCEDDPESEFVIRNYHYRTIDESAQELLDLKEPNIFPINFNAVEPDIIELLHSTRKDGKIFLAGVNKALKHPSRFLRLVPVLTHQMLNFRSDVDCFRGGDVYQFGMHKDKFDHAASILLDTSFMSKVHDDPAFVADVDALEDWEDYEALTDYAFKEHGDEGLTVIHPNGSDLLAFKKKGMPQLERSLPLYGDYKGYMNYLYRSLKMTYLPYDSSGQFSPPQGIKRKTIKAFQWYGEKTRQLMQCT